ncbi:hypothetical protein CJ030_MR5G027204 [Morella rubra]|uniref:Dienelactone hydrolase domain-containing protein n=1 Tax=Morella rubra TaxID=262757 RepID=A0A6A1VMR5_9ROSI|nr:hypothetical protein CJ030_MR5G027204 [Morella rubra]
MLWVYACFVPLKTNVICIPGKRKLADKVATAGFYVVVPDFLHGDPYAPDKADRPLPVWLKDHGPAGVKAPIAILGAEIDKLSPPELLKQFEEVLTAKPEVDGYAKIFPKVAHGWTVRYNVADEVAVQRAEEAHQHMLEWFAKYAK